jgi:hypothetical protein
MTSPRGPYGGGYYSSSAFFPDTPIYDSLVAERGTPQIAPIRVPSAYETPGSNLPALPALPALPSGPSSQTSAGMHTGYLATQPAQYQQPPANTQYLPQQNAQPRGGYTTGMQHPTPPHGQYVNGGGGYDTGAMRQVAPRPVPPRQMPPQRPAPRQAPGPYEDQYRPQQGPAY